jgi:hypothetical protein
MRGNEIRYSDPTWINRLRIGALLIFWTTITILATLASAALCDVDQIPVSVQIFIYVIVGAFLLGGIGNWLLATPDPSGIGERNYGRSRKISRAAMILAPLGTAALIAAAVARPSITPHWEYPAGLEICELIELIGAVALLQYLSKLAVRMRDTPIAERSKTLRTGYAAAGGLLLITGIAHDFVLPTDWAQQSDLGGLVLSLQAIGGLTGFLVWILWMLLLLRLARKLKEQTRLARSTWEAV